MPAARRTASFTVFRDDPTPLPAPAPAAASTTRRLTRSLSESAVSLGANATPLSDPDVSDDPAARDKENFHPHTGEQAQSVAALFKTTKVKKENAEGAGATKKRKTGVLEVKPVPAKKTRTVPSSTARPGPKERQRAASLPPVPAPAPSVRRTRTTSHYLPILSEHDEEDEVSRLLGATPARPARAQADAGADADATPSQATINAHCYDLTVLPLADVSAAYEEPESPTKPRARSRTPSAALDLRDPFSSPSHASTYSSFSGRSRAPSPSSPAFADPAFGLPTPRPTQTYDASEPASDGPSEEGYPGAFDLYSSPFDRAKRDRAARAQTRAVDGEADKEEREAEADLGQRAGKGVVFSTPERARIYSAFTFESPSPSGQRMARARRERSTSVDRWGEIPMLL